MSEMESKGLTQNVVMISFTPETLQNINDRYAVFISQETLETAIKKLLANEHIKQRCMSGCKYSNIQITLKGVAVATSLKMSAEKLKNRSIGEKISDYIENRKGLFILTGSIGTVVGIITLILKLKGIL